MFKNYLKITFRNLLKNKTYSFINIFGLAAGTLCCLYILLYVQEQYSYDKHQKNAGDIYRVNTTLVVTGDKHTNATASPPIVPTMKADFPEVMQFTRVLQTAKLGSSQNLIHYGEKSFYERKSAYVDSTFFDVFTYHFVFGNPANALKEPYSIVLLKPVADKIFGNIDPVGKMVNIESGYGKHDFKITGVIDESLGKSHISNNMFITMNSGGIGDYVLHNDRWAGNNFAHSYVKLVPGASVAGLESKLPAFLTKYGAQQLKELGMQKQLHLQPIGSIHTTTGYEVESDKPIGKTFLYVLILIATVIQVIACINFMNLSTARASKRAKEVGVRKVIGAGKTDLIRQFLGESFLLSLTGVLIAVPLLILALPYLNDLTGAQINLGFLRDYRLWLMLAGLVIVTGIVAGSYPAFYLSAFQAIKVIKGNFTNNASAAGIRRSLVVFQFVLSIVLIAGVIVIYSQLDFINHKDIGFDKQQKLIFSFYTEGPQSKIHTFGNELRGLAEVKSASEAENYLSQFIPHDHNVYTEGGNMANATDAQNIATDEFFAKTYGIKIIAGRDLRQFDSGRVLINETLMHRLGLTPEKAPGARLYSDADNKLSGAVEIVGVMKDFNYNSLHNDVKPFMLVYAPKKTMSELTVSLNSDNYPQTLAKMEAIWHKLLPETPFEFAFLDAQVQKQYETEITLARIIQSFTLMAILISCLGLFGLATFSAEQRRKEIGIRKVLGAGVMNLAGLLSKDFLRLVLIAIVIATPIAWWAMNKWLQAFAYKVDIRWWMFATAGGIAVCIALFTVSFQAIRSALSNPVNSLRTE